jgi:NitT/TauT family transport system substrate-binding protein
MALRENILTPAVQAHGIGGADPVRLQIAVEQLALVYRFKTQPTPSQAFDPSFLPAAELRRIN